jgi:hypothetical protein
MTPPVTMTPVAPLPFLAPLVVLFEVVELKVELVEVRVGLFVGFLNPCAEVLNALVELPMPSSYVRLRILPILIFSGNRLNCCLEFSIAMHKALEGRSGWVEFGFRRGPNGIRGAQARGIFGKIKSEDDARAGFGAPGLAERTGSAPTARTCIFTNTGPVRIFGNAGPA